MDGQTKSNRRRGGTVKPAAAHTRIPQRIRTFTGRMLDLERPTAEAIDIRDIAHALSQLNRFTGHTVRPYTVAEHSVIGAGLIREAIGLEFLLHDATEAYLGDVSSPLKALIGPKYAELEAAWAQAIARKFRLDDAVYDEIKVVDELMLGAELRLLVGVAEVPKLVASYTGALHEMAKDPGMIGLRVHEAEAEAALRMGSRGSVRDSFLDAYRRLMSNRFADLSGSGIPDELPF